MEQELKGVRTFLEKAAEKQGVKYNEAKADELIKSYNNDYGKLVDDVGTRFGFKPDELPKFRERAFKEYAITPPTDTDRYPTDTPLSEEIPKTTDKARSFTNDYLDFDKAGHEFDIKNKELPKSQFDIGSVDKELRFQGPAYSKEAIIEAMPTLSKIEEADSTWEGFGKELGLGATYGGNMLNQLLADAPDYLNRMLVTAYNITPIGRVQTGVGELIGKDWKMKALDLRSEKFADYTKKQQSIIRKKIASVNPKLDEDILVSAKNGDWITFTRNVARQVAESTASSIAIMTAGAATGGASMVGMGTVAFGAGKYREVDEAVPDMPEDKKVFIAGASGALEGLFETTFGSAAVGKAFVKLIANEGKDVAKGIALKGFRRGFSDLILKYPAMAPLGEGFEEWGTQITQNYVDKLSGYRPDIDVMEHSTQAFIIGAAAGASHGAVIRGARIGQDAVAMPIRRSKVKKQFEKSLEYLADIPNSEYTDEIKKATEIISDPYELSQAFDEITENNKDHISEEDYQKALYFVTSFVQNSQMNNNRDDQIDANITRFQDSNGNVSKATIDGKVWYILNPQDIGKGKVIFAKNEAGETKGFANQKVTEAVTKTPDEIRNDVIMQDEFLEQEAEKQQAIQKEAADKGIVVNQTAVGPHGKGTVISINENGTITIADTKGDTMEVQMNEVEQFKTTEQKAAEKEQEQAEKDSEDALMEGIEEGAEIESDQDEAGVRIINFSNGQSKIITPEGEQIFNTPEERDNTLKAIVDAKIEDIKPKLDDLSSEEAFEQLRVEDPESAAEIFQDEIKEVQTNAKQLRTDSKKSKSRDEKAALLKQAKQLESEAQRLEDVLNKPEQQRLVNQAETLAIELQSEQDNTPYNQLEEWQQQALGESFSSEQFANFKDENEITATLAKSWLKKKGTPIDTWVAAWNQGIEGGQYGGAQITTEDVVDFIVDNPSKNIRSTTGRMNEIRAEYKEVTGQSINNHKTFIEEKGLVPVPVIKTDDPQAQAYDEGIAKLKEAGVSDEIIARMEEQAPEQEGGQTAEDLLQAAVDDVPFRAAETAKTVKETIKTAKDEKPIEQVSQVEGDVLQREDTKEKVKRKRIGKGLAEDVETPHLNISDKASEDLFYKMNALRALGIISNELKQPTQIINSSEMPTEVRAEERRRIAEGKEAVGFYHNGTTYIISDRIKSVSDVKKTYIHESIVHKGLKGIFEQGEQRIIGKQYAKFNELMQDIFGSMTQMDRLNIAKTYFPNTYKDYFDKNGKHIHQLPGGMREFIAEEYMAELSEQEIIPTKWQDFYNKLVQIIRKTFGLTSKQFTQTDLVNIIREQRKKLAETDNKLEKPLYKVPKTAEEQADIQPTKDLVEAESLQKVEPTPETGEQKVKFRVGEQEAEITESDNFKKWSKGAPILESYGILNTKPQKSQVFKVHHGTTNEFYEFDPKVKGEIGSHFGLVNYFTSDEHDANQNYAGEGPDLTNRVELRKERIEQELEDMDETEIMEMSQKHNLKFDQETETYPAELPMAMAKEELVGSEEKVMDLYVRLDNPVVINGSNETWIEPFDEDVVSDYRDQAKEEIIEENDVAEDEVDQYENEIEDRFNELMQYEESQIVEAAQKAAWKNGVDPQVVIAALPEEASYGLESIPASAINKSMREDEELGDSQNEEGELISSQIIADFFAQLGFDGIVLAYAKDQFSNMEMDPNTSHVHLFADKPNQVKLADGENIEFSESPDIRFRAQTESPLDLKIEQLQKQRERTVSEKNRLTKQAYKRHGLFGDTQAAPTDMFGGAGFAPQEVLKKEKGFNAEIQRIDKEIILLKKQNVTGKVESSGQMAMFKVAPKADSKAFKKWFGESKVVDEKGEPLVVYHGTDKDFTEFKTEWGAWATPNAELAEEYGDVNVMPIYLSIKNPYIGSHRENIKIGVAKLLAKARSLGHDGIYLPRDKEYFEETIYYEADEDVWIALSPTQIKSATANIGTFDPESADIRFRVAESKQEIEDFVKNSEIKETVFHGTPYKFDEFKLNIRRGSGDRFNFLGDGFYFTNDTDVAQSYADTDDAQLMEVKLDLKNPYVTEDYRHTSPAHQGSFARDLGIDPLDPHLVKQHLEGKGHDGIIVRDKDDGYSEYVVFRPEQILIEPKTDVKFKVDEAASETDTNPSEEQKHAGNYKMGHVAFDGFDISIENPKGSTRSGKDQDGKEWSREMPANYGYFKGTIGKDKDHIDVFIGDNPESDKIYVIDQVNPKTGSFDEHKIMLGFDNVSKARNTYNSAYEDGWAGLGQITRTDKDGLKEWFKGDTKKPYSDVKFRVEEINRTEFQNSLESKYPGLKLFLGGRGDKLKLSQIELPKEQRGKGIGTTIMNEITDWADSNGLTISLTPSTDFGATSVSRLKKFYKGFNFVENKGRNKDFTISDSMIRTPEGDIRFRITEKTTSPEIAALFERLSALEKVSKKTERATELTKAVTSAKTPEFLKDDIKEKLNTFREGVKAGTKHTKEQIDEIESAIINYIGKNLDLGAAGARDIKSAFTALRKAKRSKMSVEKAFEKIDELTGKVTSKKVRGKNTSQIKRLMKWMGNPDSFVYANNVEFKKFRETDTETIKQQKILNSPNSTEAQKTSADNALDRMWNELDTKVEERTMLEDVQMKLIEYRRNKAEASDELIAAIREDLQIIYDAAKDARKDENIQKAIDRKSDREFVKGLIEETPLADENWNKRVRVSINNWTIDSMGNWETLLNQLLGQKGRDKFSFILNQVNQEVNRQATFDKVLDEAREAYGFKTKEEMLSHLTKMNEENYSFVKPNREGERGQGTEQQLSAMDIMDLYNAIKNENIRNDAYMTYGDISLAEDGSRDTEAQMKSGKERIDGLIDNLTDADKSFADIMQVEAEAYYPKYNKVFIQTYNRDLKKGDNYWPSSAEFKNENDAFEQFRQDAMRPRATQERTLHRTVKIANAFDKFVNHVKAGEWYANMALPVSRMNNILKNPNVKDLIIEARGEEFYKTMIVHLQEQGLNPPSKAVAPTGIENVAGTVLNNWVTAAIGLSPSVPVKQLLSVINYSENMPVGKWATGFAKTMANPVETWKEMMKIPYLKTRIGTGYSEALQYVMNADSAAPKAASAWQKFKNMMTAGTRYGDITAIVFGGKPYLDYLINEKGMSYEDAVDQFLLDTLRSQQSPFSSSLSTWQNSKNVIKRSIFAFSNTPSQYQRKMFEANEAFRKGDIDKGQLAKVYAIYGVLASANYVIVGSLMSALLRGTDWDDDLLEKVLVQFGISAVGGIPIAKDLAEGLGRTLVGLDVYDDVSPILEGANKLISVSKRLANADDDTDKTKLYLEGIKYLTPFAGMSSRNIMTVWNATVNRSKTFTATRIKKTDKTLTELAKPKKEMDTELKSGNQHISYLEHQKNKPEYKEAESASNMKSAYSSAKRKAKEFESDKKGAKSERLLELIETSKSSLAKTEYSYIDIESELRQFNRLVKTYSK